MKDSVSIEVIIGGRKYPIKTSPEDKETLIVLQNELNREIQSVQLHYSDRDRQDALAMTLISYAKRLHDLQAQVDKDQGQLTSIEEAIDKAL